jgi:spermidine synthase
VRGSRTVFEARSPLSGRIRVIDDGVERRLIVRGDTLSVYPLDGDWSRLSREYWWRALVAVPLPSRPSALFVGLGGGTQIHLLRRLRRPRALTVIERDPVILQVATAWFGLGRLGGIEFHCADATLAVPALARARRRFDFVMEDASYSDAPDRSLTMAEALVPLVASGGLLVLNRHRRRDAGAVAAVLRPRFREVRLERVRREAENVLVCGVRPVRPRDGRASA